MKKKKHIKTKRNNIIIEFIGMKLIFLFWIYSKKPNEMINFVRLINPINFFYINLNTYQHFLKFSTTVKNKTTKQVFKIIK